jgi:hypothetical protein
MQDPAIRGAGRQGGGAGVRGVILRSLLWLLLGGWIGSWACFGLVVAPIAFERLPSTEVAGHLIGPVLSALHLYGAVAGGGLTLLAGLMGRGRLRVGLPLLMAAACVYTQFGVSPEIAEIRDRVFGPEGSEALAARWAELHRRSVAIYLAVSAGTLWLLALHALSDTRDAS